MVEPVDLAPERLADLVADGRVDLPRDLRDRQAVGDREADVELEAPVEADPDPAAAHPEGGEEPAADVAPAEARHAVRAERCGSDEVDDRAAG